jgi:RNA polymerase sigma-70 factor, ECF subfamily
VPASNPLAGAEGLILRVYAYVAYRIGDGPDAQDVTSDVFERALRYQKSYDSRKGEPIAWLIGIARRCIDTVGAQPRPLPVEPRERAAPGDLEAETVRRLTLRSAMATLGERDRELISMRYGADLSAREIAAILDVPTNRIDVALHRALVRLRAALSDPAEQEAGETTRDLGMEM